MFRQLAISLLVTLSTSPFALAHGGWLRGPSPGLPVPVPNGPPTVGPATGGGPGGGGGPKTAAASKGGVTGIRKAAPVSYTNWYTWWAYNREPYLNLRDHLQSRSAVTGVANSSVRPQFEELEANVIPTLLKLAEENDPDIVDSAILALARCTPSERSETILPVLIEGLRHAQDSVKQSSILALGVLGDRSAVPMLLDILRDEKEARGHLKQTRGCDDFQRGMAAVSLGFLSDPATIPVLIDQFERSRRGTIELQSSLIMALGLFRDGNYEVVSFLAGLLGERRLEDVVRAQIPVAMARLGEGARASIPELLDLARSRKTRDHLLRSVVIALGQLATPEDPDVIKVLQTVAEDSNDVASNNFAFIALGRVCGAAAAEHHRYEEMLEDANRFLLRQLVRPKRKQSLPFVATACGLVARAYPPSHLQREVFAKKLLEVWEDGSRPEDIAATSVALGLMNAQLAGEPLLKRLVKSSDRYINGYVAEGLGLMNYAPAAPELLKQLEDDADPAYRIRVAESLGLMGDRDVSRRLADDLSNAKTLWSTSSISKALGRIGDRSALPILDKLALDESRPGLARAFAAVGIGLVGEKSKYPWNTRLAVGANYLAPFRVQSEILDIL